MLGEAAVAQEVLQRITDGRRTAFVLPARAVASNVVDAGVVAVAGAGVSFITRVSAAAVASARTPARGRPARAD
jgi:hypothetical protein